MDVAALYEHHERAIWRYLRSRLHGVDDTAVDDLAQSIWLRVWERRDQYTEREGIRVSAWLYQIAHNLLVDWLRWQQRKMAASLDALAEQGREMTVTYRWDQIHERERVARALAQIPPDYRQIVDLRFYRGWTVSDVATAMGSTEDSIKQRQYRAFIQLRTVLTGEAPAAERRGRPEGSGRPRTDMCLRGHPRDDATNYARRDGVRVCQACRRDRYKAKREVA